jgi:hypothetical protein
MIMILFKEEGQHWILGIIENKNGDDLNFVVFVFFQILKKNL